MSGELAAASGGDVTADVLAELIRLEKLHSRDNAGLRCRACGTSHDCSTLMIVRDAMKAITGPVYTHERDEWGDGYRQGYLRGRTDAIRLIRQRYMLMVELGPLDENWEGWKPPLVAPPADSAPADEPGEADGYAEHPLGGSWE